MQKNKPKILLEYINLMVNLFLVNEHSFPSAKGKMRYNPIDFQTLRYVNQHPDCRGIEIAQSLSIAPTTLQSALDRLIKKNLIQRNDHPTDKRGKIHKLTQEGTELFEAIYEQDMTNMQFLLETLSEAEQDNMIKILDKITNKIKRL